MSAGCAYEFYSGIRGPGKGHAFYRRKSDAFDTGRSGAFYKGMGRGRNDSTTGCNDAGLRGVDRPFHDSSLNPHYRSRNGVQNGTAFLYRALPLVNQIRTQRLALPG